MALSKSVTKLSDLFSSLPGIGPKLSKRIAVYLAVKNKSLSAKLADTLTDVVENIRECNECFNVTEGEICEICANDQRDKDLILIVESPIDLYSIEETGSYNGLYHVLGGVISPVNGIGPDDLNITELLTRVGGGDIKEIISGLNPNLEGESTSMYIKSEIDGLGLEVKYSQLAKGIPSGSSIEFMSSQTLSDSLQRRENL